MDSITDGIDRSLDMLLNDTWATTGEDRLRYKKTRDLIVASIEQYLKGDSLKNTIDLSTSIYSLNKDVLSAPQDIAQTEDLLWFFLESIVEKETTQKDKEKLKDAVYRLNSATIMTDMLKAAHYSFSKDSFIGEEGYMYNQRPYLVDEELTDAVLKFHKNKDYGKLRKDVAALKSPISNFGSSSELANSEFFYLTRYLRSSKVDPVSKTHLLERTLKVYEKYILPSSKRDMRFVLAFESENGISGENMDEAIGKMFEGVYKGISEHRKYLYDSEKVVKDLLVP